MEIIKGRDIVFSDNLFQLLNQERGEFISHSLCTDGECEIEYNNTTLHLRKGDCMIVVAVWLITGVRPSADFKVKVIDVSPNLLIQSSPQNNYGIRGTLSLFQHPIISLSSEEFIRCSDDFDAVMKRCNYPEHHFYAEIVSNSLEALFLDFFDFHVEKFKENPLSAQTARLMSAFLEMLNQRTYLEHREVSYYADKLCVTPKYLSEISKKISGFAASYWINRYTVAEIRRCLYDRSLSFTAIADRFGFSSTAYFSKYVLQNLGATPTEIRR